MLDFFSKLFSTSDFPARWSCGRWTSGHGWLHIMADLAIFGAYAAIPTAILLYMFRRREVFFPRLYWLFAFFIFSCGFGHLVEASLFWHPWYRFYGMVKVVTAAASWITVGALVRKLPEAIALPVLARLNAELKNEIQVRKQAEEEVRRLNEALSHRVEELQTLLDVLPVGIGIAEGRACRTIRTNPAFAAMLGMNRQDNASLSASAGEAPNHFEVRHEGQTLKAEELPIQRAALEDRVICDFEEELVFQDGHSLHLVAYGAPLHDGQGAVRGAVGAFIDITARKKAEAERQEVERGLLHTQKLESLGVLAGGIAHDFNNLLTGVLGNASLARNELPAGCNARRHVERIEISATRAADLCRQMLAYAGKGRVLLRKLDLSRLVEDTLHLLRLSISKKAELKLELTGSLPAIEADPTQISQVVMNLVMNASDALGENPGRIQISTRVLPIKRSDLAGAILTPDLPVGEYICLEVSDTGAGMTPETVARIFEPFFTTKFTGRGLGLAAVLGIVRGHKGALRVASEPGRGTVFTVLLPRAEGNPDPPTRDRHDEVPWRTEGKVLVIDDEAGVRAVVAGVLKVLGLETVAACDGREGVEKFRAAPESFDLILLDLTMPVLDGYQVFQAIRQLNPQARVILMSGYDAPNAADSIQTQGLAGYIQKPFSIETAQHVIRSVLDPASLVSSELSN